MAVTARLQQLFALWLVQKGVGLVGFALSLFWICGDNRVFDPDTAKVLLQMWTDNSSIPHCSHLLLKLTPPTQSSVFVCPPHEFLNRSRRRHIMLAPLLEP